MSMPRCQRRRRMQVITTKDHGNISTEIFRPHRSLDCPETDRRRYPEEYWNPSSRRRRSSAARIGLDELNKVPELPDSYLSSRCSRLASLGLVSDMSKTWRWRISSWWRRDYRWAIVMDDVGEPELRASRSKRQGPKKAPIFKGGRDTLSPKIRKYGCVPCFNNWCWVGASAIEPGINHIAENGAKGVTQASPKIVAIEEVAMQHIIKRTSSHEAPALADGNQVMETWIAP